MVPLPPPQHAQDLAPIFCAVGATVKFLELGGSGEAGVVEAPLGDLIEAKHANTLGDIGERFTASQASLAWPRSAPNSTFHALSPPTAHPPHLLTLPPRTSELVIVGITVPQPPSDGLTFACALKASPRRVGAISHVALGLCVTFPLPTTEDDTGWVASAAVG